MNKNNDKISPFTAEEEALLLILPTAENDKSDCIVCLEGDYFHRIDHAVNLYKAGVSNYILISGGLDAPEKGSFLAPILKERAIKKGAPPECLILEDKSLNTFEEGIEVLKIAIERNFRSITLVASEFHQQRAYMTFIKAAIIHKTKVVIYNNSSLATPWFTPTDYKISRYEMLIDELGKISRYKDHVCTAQELKEYLIWKEGQSQR